MLPPPPAPGLHTLLFSSPAIYHPFPHQDTGSAQFRLPTLGGYHTAAIGSPSRNRATVIFESAVPSLLRKHPASNRLRHVMRFPLDLRRAQEIIGNNIMSQSGALVISLFLVRE